MKELNLQAPRPLLDILCLIVRQYAEAAYPVGGSDCAQAARASLLDTTERIEQNYDPVNSSVAISRRIKSHIKAAIKYYVQLEAEQGKQQQAHSVSALLLDCLDGQVLSEQQVKDILDL